MQLERIVVYGHTSGTRRYCCGDLTCTGAETTETCLLDYPLPYCGDAVCGDSGNSCDCPADCGAAPTSEAGLCHDGLDNDCDLQTDCSDGDCSPDAACLCVPKNEWCSTDAEC